MGGPPGSPTTEQFGLWSPGSFLYSTQPHPTFAAPGCKATPLASEPGSQLFAGLRGSWNQSCVSPEQIPPHVLNPRGLISFFAPELKSVHGLELT